MFFKSYVDPCKLSRYINGLRFGQVSYEGTSYTLFAVLCLTIVGENVGTYASQFRTGGVGRSEMRCEGTKIILNIKF